MKNKKEKLKEKLKEKSKEKLIDTVCTFIGSILALLVYYHISGAIQKLLLGFMGIPKGFINVSMGAVFSILVALGFFVTSLLWFGLESIRFYKKPVIDVTFYDENKKELKKLSFVKSPEEPKFLKIKFETQLSRFQVKIIRLIKPIILIDTNPPMCAFEFDTGFPYEINDYRIEDNIIQCDVMKRFGVSDVVLSMNMDFNVQLIMPANGVIKIETLLQTKNIIYKILFRYYCKYEAKLEIKGE